MGAIMAVFLGFSLFCLLEIFYFIIERILKKSVDWVDECTINIS